MSTRNLFVFLLAAIIFIWTPSKSVAQSTGVVAGTVVSAETDVPLPGVNVVLEDTQHGAATDEDGQFLISALAPDTYTLEAHFLGYQSAEQTVTVVAGDTTQVRFALEPAPVQMQGIEVTALQPDLQPTSELETKAVREANPRDSGELLRELPGLDAVRRGPVGLDPVVRGLRETEVGIYIDGTRSFASCAGRMDSPLSHLDPTAIEAIEVVGGPYALTWGSGNLSAIRIETPSLHAVTPGTVHGRFTSGYDSNFGSYEGGLSLSGRQDALAYRFHGAWREGNDYTAGNGVTVPADFLSREARGTVGYELAPGSHLSVAASYQNQRDVDYPGRMMNAASFDAYNVSAEWELERTEGFVRGAEVLAYYNAIDHTMNNDGKPTAEPDPERMPPFALDITMPSSVDVVGGRAAVDLALFSGHRMEVGADVYSALRSSTRHVRRRDTGDLMETSFVWPDARITDAGLFARTERGWGGGWRLAGSTRLDFARAHADTANAFFLDNVTDDLKASEVNVSGAVTLGVTPSPHWSATIGVGSTVRTADATERYADRLPSSKAQTSAEFVGDPALAPERNTQIDLWLEGDYTHWSLSANVFARRLDDYITLRATELSPRMMGGPETVYQYANGTATFYGGEASVARHFSLGLIAEVRGGYLWGKDVTLDEPALGVTPLQGDVRLRYEPDEGRFFIESVLHLVGKQTRVAATRGEEPTGGYETLDLKGGVSVTEGVALQFGVTNLTEVTYVNHLNAKNPYTGVQLPEPGRVFFADLTVSF